MKMRIAFNARLLLQNQLEGIGWHGYQIISRMIINHPEHTFLLYYDRKKNIIVPEGKNVIVKSLFPVSRHPLLLWIWTQISLRNAVLRDKVDIYYSPEPIMPLSIPIPRIITVHDISPKVLPDSMPIDHSLYYRYILRRNIPKAIKIFAVSAYTKKEIVSHYKVLPEKIEVIYNAARSEFKPISTIDKIATREKYSQGFPYFLSLSSIHQRKNIDKVVQSFNTYTDKYQTEQRLIIVGRKMGLFADVEESISSSKFQNYIIQLGYLPDAEITKILASADALINLSEYEGFGMQLVESFQSGVPVIASEKSCYPEISGGAAILVNPRDIFQIAEQMGKLSTDTPNLVKAGLERAKDFNWNDSAKRAFMFIEKAFPINAISN